MNTADEIFGHIRELIDKAWEKDAAKLDTAASTLRRARFGSRALKTETGVGGEKLHVSRGKPVGGYDPTSYERLGGTHKDRPIGAATHNNRNKAGNHKAIGMDLHFRAAHKLGNKPTNPRQGHYYDIDPGWTGRTSQ